MLKAVYKLLWRMRIFLYIATLGYVAWIGSEIAELLAQGYTPTVFLLTAIYHLLAGLGIWGLHRAQAQSAGKLSLVGATLISLSFLALIYFPLGAMQAGLTPPEYASTRPLFQLVGLMNIFGFILFGIAIYRARIFPRWTGPMLAIGNLLFAALLASGGGPVRNAVSIGLALVVLWMIKFVFRQENASEA